MRLPPGRRRRRTSSAPRARRRTTPLTAPLATPSPADGSRLFMNEGTWGVAPSPVEQSFATISSPARPTGLPSQPDTSVCESDGCPSEWGLAAVRRTGAPWWRTSRSARPDRPADRRVRRDHGAADRGHGPRGAEALHARLRARRTPPRLCRLRDDGPPRLPTTSSPATAVAIGQLGGLGVLDLEGLWTRFDDPEPILGRGDRAWRGSGHQAAAGDLRGADQGRADRPAHRGDLAGQAWSPPAGLSPQRTARYYKAVARRRARTSSSSAGRPVAPPSMSPAAPSRSTSSSSI